MKTDTFLGLLANLHLYRAVYNELTQNCYLFVNIKIRWGYLRGPEHNNEVAFIKHVTLIDTQT